MLGTRASSPSAVKAATLLGTFPSSRTSSSSSSCLSSPVQWFKRRPLVVVTFIIGVFLLSTIVMPFLMMQSAISNSSHTASTQTTASSSSLSSLFTQSQSLLEESSAKVKQALNLENRMERLRRQAKESSSKKTTNGIDAEAITTSSGTTETNTTSTPASISLRPAQPIRAAAVVSAFKHAWLGYTKTCWGQDDLLPLSHTCSNWVGAGLTIIDGLSTMMVIGDEMKDEILRARQWIDTSLSFKTRNQMNSFFETTIRILGGLLSAHDLSGEKDTPYLRKAKELGDLLMPAFNTPSGLPRGQVNLVSGAATDHSWTPMRSTLLAEVATVQLEFNALSQRTGDPQYHRVAQKVMDVLDEMNPPDHLYPIYLSPETGKPVSNTVTLGAMGDSAYEYFLKQWLITGRTNKQYKKMYVESMRGVISRLIQSTDAEHGSYKFVADMHGGSNIERKMDHLVCFVPGMLALGVEEGIIEGAEADEHLALAKELMRTCFHSYDMTSTKIGPEVMVFPNGMQSGESSYKLRPEMVESLFVLYRVTGDEQYREQAWQTFMAIEKYCKVEGGGYAALRDVNNPASSREDKMESFFLAETLKYLYLIFADESKLAISGKKQPGEYFVFNTECHPIKSWKE